VIASRVWLISESRLENSVQLSKRTLDLYTQGDSDEMSTAQQLFADAVDWGGLEKPTQVM
jgi:hypothetical protein